MTGQEKLNGRSKEERGGEEERRGWEKGEKRREAERGEGIGDKERRRRG
jgi:hypothetical protein